MHGSESIALVCGGAILNTRFTALSGPPAIEEFAHYLANCRFFSILDLAKPYYQIHVASKNIPKTAIYKPVLWNFNFCFVYFDDVLTAASTSPSICHISSAFSLLDNGLILEVEKYEFLQPKGKFLDDTITPDGVQPDPDKMQTIASFPLPKRVKDLRRFFYRRFLSNAAYH